MRLTFGVHRWLMGLGFTLQLACARTTETAVKQEPAHGACGRDALVSCAGDVPVYERDVEPILRTQCFGCHAAGGEATPDHDFSIATKVFAQRSSIRRQVAACAMPPRRAPALSEQQASVILRWAACSNVAK